jgi:hypothetical protein
MAEGPRHPLEDVPVEHAFHFHDGKRAHNLEDLRDAIATMPPEQFSHHVSPSRNDFAEWVEHVFRNPALAEGLRKADRPDLMVELLEEEIARHDDAAVVDDDGPLLEPLPPKGDVSSPAVSPSVSSASPPAAAPSVPNSSIPSSIPLPSASSPSASSSSDDDEIPALPPPPEDPEGPAAEVPAPVPVQEADASAAASDAPSPSSVPLSATGPVSTIPSASAPFSLKGFFSGVVVGMLAGIIVFAVLLYLDLLPGVCT